MKNLTREQWINLVLVILLIVFVAQNLEEVRLHILTFSFDFPLFLLIAIVFTIGYFVAKAFHKK